MITFTHQFFTFAYNARSPRHAPGYVTNACDRMQYRIEPLSGDSRRCTLQQAVDRLPRILRVRGCKGTKWLSPSISPVTSPRALVFVMIDLTKDELHEMKGRKGNHECDLLVSAAVCFVSKPDRDFPEEP